jgi:spore maturation protein CgeB
MGEFLRSCKIVLNFSSTAVISAWELNDGMSGEIPQVDHVKGRVFEAIACGALLLESRNTRTTAYFTPDEHYVEFSDLEELIEKIQYFSANENHRRHISNAGNQRFLGHYTAEHFWRQLEVLIDRPRAGS